MGYQNRNSIIVYEMIDSGAVASHDTNHFEYDASYVEKKANFVAVDYYPRLALAGIWHSHTNGDVFLSEDDIELSQNFARDSINGIIHLLVTID